MSFLAKLLRRRADDHAAERPLWHAIAGAARDPAWFLGGGVADTVSGRFDAITLVLCAVLLRMEREDALIAPSVRLTELFVTDMDGQLRESGVGDAVVGKHMGKVMATLGGRLGALREGLAANDQAVLEGAVARNVTLRDGADASGATALLRDLVARLDAHNAAGVLAARFLG